MKLGLATLGGALAVLTTAAPAQASIPMPWCLTAPAALDRVPDATPGFAVHVAYVHAPETPNRLGEWAPRIVGDIAAIDAWWRSQDATRVPRFDLFPVACETPFGMLDISSVTLPQGLRSLSSAYTTIRFLLASESDFLQPEKVYLVYFDGSTGQVANERVCGQGAAAEAVLPGLAVVYLDSCDAETSDSQRTVVAVHELLHIFGAVAVGAPHLCSSGHVCDIENDLMNPSLSELELDAHLLDGGRDDYYGHAGGWLDVQDSIFLERLDSPDRAAPAVPTGLTATNAGELARLSWQAATDDVGPVSYRVYQDDRFVLQLPSTSATLGRAESATSSYSVRAVDPVGHLSQPARIRFNVTLGIVDEQGRLLRDTVRPAAVRNVAVRRAPKTVGLRWPAVRDGGGIRGYRVKLGTRTLTVRKPGVTLSRARLRTPVTLAAVDRAGNVGPTTVVPLHRLR